MKTTKRILIGLAAAGTGLALIPMFAAFEAHVVNVTATIENALNVPLQALNFGTVFPQERLDETFDVSLSRSFQGEDRVDDVDYVIRQKPKCGLPQEQTDPVTYTDFKPVIGENEDGTFICPENYVVLPLLCPYLSKTEITTDGTATSSENDSAGITAFHGLPGAWTLATTIATQVKGHLAKSEQDLSDTWNIDLKVPCFEGACAQDWDEFVTGINPHADPDDYIASSSLEHQLFGCDLWLEVGGISLPGGGLGCKGQVDVMLVLDTSGSIDSGELTTLKTAAKAFVGALGPSATGTHIGLVSFSSGATLDVHLTSDSSTVNTAIDALSSGGSTNLASGITTADTELLNPGDGHDRTDGTSPDVMVILTDGNPNFPDGEAAAEAAAAAAAATAKGNTVEIFVVGIGTTTSTTLYLQNNIVTAPTSTHYFDSADFSSLETVLANLAACTP